MIDPFLGSLNGPLDRPIKGPSWTSLFVGTLIRSNRVKDDQEGSILES